MYLSLVPSASNLYKIRSLGQRNSCSLSTRCTVARLITAQGMPPTRDMIQNFMSTIAQKDCLTVRTRSTHDTHDIFSSQTVTSLLSAFQVDSWRGLNKPMIAICCETAGNANIDRYALFSVPPVVLLSILKGSGDLSAGTSFGDVGSAH